MSCYERPKIAGGTYQERQKALDPLIRAGERVIVEARKKAQLSSYLEKHEIDYQIFSYLYDLYYFVPDRNKEEQKVLELLQKYTTYEAYYWKQAEQEEKEEDEERKHPFLSIMECITDGTQELVEEMKVCILDTETYLKKHLEEFGEWGITPELWEEEGWDDYEMEVIQWIALTNILKREGYGKEWNGEEEKEAFLQQIPNTNMVLCAFDMDGDSYVAVPCRKEKSEQLKEWAGEAGFRIVSAKEI